MASVVFVEKPAAEGLMLTNLLGADIAQGEFCVMAGKSLMAKEAVVSAAVGAFEDLLGAQVQADDYVTGEATFATGELPVYWEPVTRKFSNTATAANYHVGYTLGAKVGAIIKFIAIDPRVIISDAATMAAAIATLQGVGWTNETVKGLADIITAIKGAGWTVETIKANADAIVAAANLGGKYFRKTAVLTSALATTPVDILTSAEVGAGKKAYITSLLVSVGGTDVWAGTGTVVLIRDKAASPVTAISLAKAQLGANAVLGMVSTGVTLATPVRTGVGMTTAKGLELVADGTFETTGSDLSVTVCGYIA